MSPKSFVTYVPRLYLAIDVLLDANANAVAPVYDRVNVDLIVDPDVHGPVNVTFR
jgi:hypothetical protein